MSDQSKQWQEIASQGIATERTLRTRIEALEERMRGADALIVLWETRATRAEARVEQLEKHKRLQTEDVMNLGAQLGQACLRIEQLEAEVEKWHRVAMEAGAVTCVGGGHIYPLRDRVKQLEVALRNFKDKCIQTVHEQRCERGTPWDLACVTIANEIAALALE
jgi:chromosome segregation ATPase